MRILQRRYQFNPARANCRPRSGKRDPVDELLRSATDFLLNKGMVREGEIVVCSAGVPVGVSGGTNMIKVVKVERAD